MLLNWNSLTEKSPQEEHFSKLRAYRADLFYSVVLIYIIYQVYYFIYTWVVVEDQSMETQVVARCFGSDMTI